MITTADIATYGVHYIWKDDPSRTVHFGLIGDCSAEVMSHLTKEVELGNPEWLDFDEQVLYYIDSLNGETIESLSNFDNQNAEFLVVEGTE